MIRVDRTKYPIRAYLERYDELKGFWCKVERRKIITTDVGQEMAASNRVLLTPEKLDFEIGEMIRLTREGESLSIDGVSDYIDETNESSRRGNPTKIYRIELS